MNKRRNERELRSKNPKLAKYNPVLNNQSDDSPSLPLHFNFDRLNDLSDTDYQKYLHNLCANYSDNAFGNVHLHSDYEMDSYPSFLIQDSGRPFCNPTYQQHIDEQFANYISQKSTTQVANIHRLIELAEHNLLYDFEKLLNKIQWSKAYQNFIFSFLYLNNKTAFIQYFLKSPKLNPNQLDRFAYTFEFLLVNNFPDEMRFLLKTLPMHNPKYVISTLHLFLKMQLEHRDIQTRSPIDDILMASLILKKIQEGIDLQVIPLKSELTHNIEKTLDHIKDQVELQVKGNRKNPYNRSRYLDFLKIALKYKLFNCIEMLFKKDNAYFIDKFIEVLRPNDVEILKKIINLHCEILKGNEPGKKNIISYLADIALINPAFLTKIFEFTDVSGNQIFKNAVETAFLYMLIKFDPRNAQAAFRNFVNLSNFDISKLSLYELNKRLEEPKALTLMDYCNRRYTPALTTQLGRIEWFIKHDLRGFLHYFLNTRCLSHKILLNLELSPDHIAKMLENNQSEILCELLMFDFQIPRQFIFKEDNYTLVMQKLLHFSLSHEHKNILLNDLIAYFLSNFNVLLHCINTFESGISKYLSHPALRNSVEKLCTNDRKIAIERFRSVLPENEWNKQDWLSVDLNVTECEPKEPATLSYDRFFGDAKKSEKSIDQGKSSQFLFNI